MLDEHGPPREAEEGRAGVSELGRPGQHRPVNLVALAGVGVDRRPAVDERVEEGERPGQPEALGADLEHEERPVAGRLDVECDELGRIQRRVGADAAGLDRQLLEEVAALTPDGDAQWLRARVWAGGLGDAAAALEGSVIADGTDAAWVLVNKPSGLVAHELTRFEPPAGPDLWLITSEIRALDETACNGQLNR